jgi:hypothetical protein
MGYPSGVQAPRRRVIPAALAAVALAAALASAGCGSSGPATDGPLRGGPFGGPSGGADGADARVGQPVTFGDERFTNHGHTTVVLDRVALRHPRHVRLIGSYAVPGVGLAGVGRGWPPRYSGLPPTWKYRQPVHGFRLAPGKSFNMVLGVVAAAGTPCARSPGMVIYYHDSAGSYVADDHFAMIIAVGRRECGP